MRSKAMRIARLLLALLLILSQIWVPGGASAQTQTPPTPQFFFTGFIQEATLDTTGAICTPAPQTDVNGNSIDVSRLRGGTMTVNGIKMIVPCNSIVQLPANTMTWADLFDPARSTPVGTYIGAPAVPVPANPIVVDQKTGLALADNPMPFPSFAVNVNGNVVNGKYIVGLIVPATQQDLNASSGLVSYMDYTIGAFRVGGIPNDSACVANGITSPLCSGSLVQFNDPVTNAGPDGTSGRWGLTHSPDPRFSGDTANTTIHTSTGFPLCIPRVAPPGIDTECPLKNRPLNGDSRFPTDPFIASGAPLKIFDMPTPAAADADPTLPDPRKAIPLMVGDQVVYSGTLYKINPLAQICDPVTGVCIPDNTAANAYISAHTVEDVLGIFTQPGVPPAYVYIEAMLIGTNGAAVQGILQEASTRMTVVGFTTDPTRLVNIYARDVDPCTGQVTLRALASEDPSVDAIRGRFVHRVLGGLFMPPTRNYLIRTQTQTIDPLTGQRVDVFAANRILTGEFSLPLFEYIFPENHRLGDPFIPNNYQDLPFLARGEGPVDGFGSGTAIIGQLTPWPGIPAPTPMTCAPSGGSAPVVTLDPNVLSVATGGTLVLPGAVTFNPADDPTTRTIQWTPAGSLTNPTSAVTSFLAPATPGDFTFTLTATDNFGTGTATVTVHVVNPPDLVQIPAGLCTWVVAKKLGKRGGFGKFNCEATSSDVTATLTLLSTSNDAANGQPTCPLTNPVPGGTCNWGTGTTKGNGIYDWVEIKGFPMPLSITVTSDKGGSATVTCSAPDAKGRVSCP